MIRTIRPVILLAVAALAIPALLACSALDVRRFEASKLFRPVLGYPPGYAEASRQAFLNQRSPANVTYYRLIDEQFGEQFRNALKHCRWDVAETRGATLLYRLDPSGNRVESMVYPVSSLSECILPYVNAYTFPPPPSEDYWIAIEIPGCLNSARAQCVEVYLE